MLIMLRIQKINKRSSGYEKIISYRNVSFSFLNRTFIIMSISKAKENVEVKLFYLLKLPLQLQGFSYIVTNY